MQSFRLEGKITAVRRSAPKVLDMPRLPRQDRIVPYLEGYPDNALIGYFGYVPTLGSLALIR